MTLPNPANAGTFDVEQDHARLVIDVLGLDHADLASAFGPIAETGRPSMTARSIAYRRRVLLALRTARVDGKGLSYLEISYVTGGLDRSGIHAACRCAALDRDLTESEIRALQQGVPTTGEHA